ncbi:MAG: hypothetical protein R3C28_30010 [Pirellulaceae bacterium]
MIATIWMFAKDHSREWKTYQRLNREIETRLTSWRLEADESDDKRMQLSELNDKLQLVLATPPAQPLFAAFIAALDESAADLKSSLESQYQELTAASGAESSDGLPSEQALKLRKNLFNEMDRAVSNAKFHEARALGLRKFKSADYDEQRANYDLGVRDAVMDAELDQLMEKAFQERSDRDELTLEYQDATAYRMKLQGLLRSMQEDESAVRKQIEDVQLEYNRLKTSLEERDATYFTSTFPFLGKRVLELPIFDAFNSPLKVQNLWTDGLTQPMGSFRQVRRFDRCTTCHQNVEKTAPGSAVKPAYEHQHITRLTLKTPESAPAGDATLIDVYGLQFAARGLVEFDDVTVKNVLPESLAATARAQSADQSNGIQVGDIIVRISGNEIFSEDQATRLLLTDFQPGQPLTVEVLRGLPHPFASHPRLDLFVGSLSPHKLSVFGCTVCHEGQGSATDFKWVSHSPSNPRQEEQWIDEYGWFNNHHWIYPMFPARFAESACLKCHHTVVELRPSERFPEAPAPKLMEGYDLISSYGCFGCHEINGYNGPASIGPDMRLEPNYFAAAAQVKVDPAFAALDQEKQDWVHTLVQHPEQTSVRRKLREFIKTDAVSDTPLLTATSHKMASVLDDIESPGEMRKVGPSLRHIAAKNGKTFLYDWIRDPSHFRPSTKMPRFFGHWDHLNEEERAVSERFEPIEILGTVQFLLTMSQSYEAETPSVEISDDPNMIERGKLAFETRGCLACHQHDDFPYAQATKAPDLTGIGNKFTMDDNPDANLWLYNWLKNPSNYHPRTSMPDLILDPIQDSDGNVTDPAADIAAYLLSSTTDWHVAEATEKGLDVDEAALNDLVLEHLKSKIFIRDAEQAISKGRIPDEVAATLSGAELQLVGDQLDTQKKLMYIGEKTIGKFGCYACHDIPGFEDAKPIGAALADWGRKEPSKIAFEHIVEYLHEGQHGHGAHGNASGDEPHHDEDHEDDAHSESGDAQQGGDFDESYYVQKLQEHDRTGFIWQKLKEPRSYDYQKAEMKDSYNDRLRMPQFPFDPQEREAVVTFVLGLVADPPAHQFVYHPNERQAAMIAGSKAIEKYNCKGCHIFESEKWELQFEKGAIPPQSPDIATMFPFMQVTVPSAELNASAEADPFTNLVTAHIKGMPRLNNDGNFAVFDYDGTPLSELDEEEIAETNPEEYMYPFDIWEPSLIDGSVFQPGLSPLEIPARQIVKKRSSVGGDLTHWLRPRALEVERERNSGAEAAQVWGWLPPPLIDEGNKVQAAWLHDFLLEPYAIRPGVFMRMPKFNMSSDEATAIVHYFAARDNANYPYEFEEATDTNRLNRLDQQYATSLGEADDALANVRFEHAMNIVVDKNYCVTCHYVGDFDPKRGDRSTGPNLADVEKRLRPDYVRRWVANPAQILPYTPMPVNIKFDANAENLGGVSQDLYHGTSLEQLDALVDLLMNFSQYTQNKTSITDMVPSAEASENSDGDSE